MELPDKLVHYDQRYPYLILIPIGREHKKVRSIGHKYERSVLSRLNDLISERALLSALPDDVMLPVPIGKDETIYPHLIRPDRMLWRDISVEDGLILDEEDVYEEDFTKLSAAALAVHVNHVLQDYQFNTMVAGYSREYWLNQIAEAFHLHPLIKLTRKKKAVIQSLERMNQSSLLAVLKYPEDVARWRDRLEYMMRPFRTVPASWLNKQQNLCNHEKHLTFDSSRRAIACHCENCHYTVEYTVDQHMISLQEEFNVMKAETRLGKLEDEFTHIINHNHDITSKLQQLAELKSWLLTDHHQLEENLHVANWIMYYQPESDVMNQYPALMVYRELKNMTLPHNQHNNALQWLSTFEIDNMAVLTQLPNWLARLPVDLAAENRADREELVQLLELVKYQRDDVVIKVKDFPLTFEKAQMVINLVETYGDHYPTHMLVHMLSGKATHKIRSLQLHEAQTFGLLSDWPEKYIPQLLNMMEDHGWLSKQRKGYTVTSLALDML
ncbi:RQC-minor-2 family DNA-binding protein [Thalassobacillus sp. CUG 92003]|uniref:RQC-minor-2 family DNA-binding protein n=1 Tax=Thalassobacillus sp. CUG 92003 TaxID=2736641 RepID=UPI0015E7554F|nr:RQC-minor-2 family DNA-binding protein [Thalassobacillus sp. CUG 92003]